MSAPNLRQRKGGDATSTSTPAPNGTKVNPRQIYPYTRVLDVLRILITMFVFSSTLSYFVTNDGIWWGHRPQFTRPAWIMTKLMGSLTLTPTELAKYDGSDPKLPIYLSLNGTIYDVSAGPQHYGPGGTYHSLAGRDATRAFVTGCFDTDQTSDLRGVELMYMPLDLDSPPVVDMSVSEAERKKARGEWKVKREQARRFALGRVHNTVDGWRKMFDGGKGGKYWMVGTLKGGREWEGSELRELCAKAKNARPKVGPADGYK